MVKDRKKGEPLVQCTVRVSEDVAEWADMNAKRLNVSRAIYLRMLLVKAKDDNFKIETTFN